MWSRIVKLGLVSMALLALGCVGELELTNPPIGGPGADGGGGGGTPGEIAFNTNVFPAIGDRVCTSCHTDATCAAIGGGHCFLGTGQAASAYIALKGSVYFAATPAGSTFITHGEHTGKAFCEGAGTAAGGAADADCTIDQVTPINDWITQEAGGGL